ncbi:MAG: hypothetical protein EON98_00775 [Chitinophagaceae bacterium]|nr:MAG: hypothetical protein EON98_00775 [Chitinophagaceae bacterium]
MSFSPANTISTLVDLLLSMHKEVAIKQKVKELEEELVQAGLWNQHEPRWVHQFQEATCGQQKNFFEWLQFVYLPNLVSGNTTHSYASKQVYIAPQAVYFLGEDADRTNLLRLLVELDALLD